MIKKGSRVASYVGVSQEGFEWPSQFKHTAMRRENSNHILAWDRARVFRGIKPAAPITFTSKAHPVVDVVD